MGHRRYRLPLVAVMLAVLLCSACGDLQRSTDARQGENACCPTVPPDVTGQSAVKAVAHIRRAGYRHIRFWGRWSPEPRGTVLAQHPGPNVYTPTHRTIRLIASMGPRRHAHGPIFVPGVATCDLGPPSPGAICAGGPVALQPQH
jgi:hypothetical protein